MTFTIPTADELSDRLGGLDRLLTAKRWERAAIVWAFTTSEHGGDRRSSGESAACFPMPCTTFARLGFSGLASDRTVRKYREAWQRAIDAGLATSVAPGESDVEMPDMEWPGVTPETARGLNRVYGTDSPERKAEVVRNILADPAAREEYERIAEHRPQPEPSPAPEPEPVPHEPSARAREITRMARESAQERDAERTQRDNSPAGSYSRFVTELGVATSRLKLAVHLYQTHAEDWQPAQRADAAELMDLHRAGAVLDVDWDAALADMTDQG